MHWSNQSGPRDDLVFSSRVRLARNWRDMPFPDRMQSGHTESCLQRVQSVLTPQEGYSFVRTAELSPQARQMLVERHAASPALLANAARSGLARNGDESVAVMVLEEDALRIQAFAPGMQLQACYETAGKIDDRLCPEGTVAFDEKLGYLTACPSNLGTGMRASLFLHLPALTMTQTIPQLAAALAKMGLTLRGFYGEGSRAQGQFYQMSNQVTLGYAEAELIATLNGAAEQVIGMEQQKRAALRETGMVFEDTLMRAVGVLQQARVLPLPECMQNLSLAILAADSRLYDPPRTLKTLLTQIQPATLRQTSPMAGDEDLDVTRARLVREYIAP